MCWVQVPAAATNLFMKYTHENIIELLTKFNELQEQVSKFESGARINYETFTIQHEENTACNCHPEYEWVDFATIDQFLEWHEKQQVTEKSQKA